MIWGASSCFRRSRAGRGRPQEVQNAPKGAPGEPQMGPRSAPSRKTAPGAAKRRTEAKMEPQRPSNEPQEASGVRESTGKQLGAPRRKGKRPASARSTRARAPRESSSQHRGLIGETPEHSLHHRQATAGTGKRLAPPPSHRQASDNSSTNVCKKDFF